ncbi:MAG TPA: hypothetical protein VGX76_18885 [Pirellulales bacterium]|nr:hypothetical protein [Pirellulales bacterium]
MDGVKLHPHPSHGMIGTVAETTGEVDCGRDPRSAPIRVRGRLGGTTIQPLTVGVPWPKGALAKATGLKLTDESGADLPVQAEALSHWSDGSVKWLLVDTLLSCPDQSQRTLRLSIVDEAAGHEAREAFAPMRVEQAADEFVVHTGVATYRVDRRRLALEATRTLLAGCVAGPVLDCVFRDASGRRRSPFVRRSLVETAGPVRTTLVLEGTIRRARGLRFRCRLCFFAGTDLVRLRFTLHNPNRAEHRGGLWDLGDAGSVLFRGLSLVVHAGPDRARAIWTV